jgi:hypothetical protein
MADFTRNGRPAQFDRGYEVFNGTNKNGKSKLFPFSEPVLILVFYYCSYFFVPIFDTAGLLLLLTGEYLYAVIMPAFVLL